MTWQRESLMVPGCERILHLWATIPFLDEARVWRQCWKCGCVIINHRIQTCDQGDMEIGHCGCGIHYSGKTGGLGEETLKGERGWAKNGQ